jgi:phosphatidylserine decarboxylase
MIDVMRKAVLVPIHRDGWPFIAAFALISLLLGSTVSEPVGWLGALATAWCVFFFRDPDRVVPQRGNLVVSPADGLVQMIQPAVPPSELGMAPGPLTRVSIFLNVFDVHVNRVPMDGVVTRLAYRAGKFFNAALEKASELNERQSVRLTLPDGRELAFVQIAGLVARRIRCDLKEGFGLIRFGSRVDVYLPQGAAPLVAIGQRMVAGETVIADLVSSEPSRGGEVR